MIYTLYGVEIKIKAHATDRSSALVEAIDDPDWQRVYPLGSLRADDGLPEVMAAMDACGYEYPPQQNSGGVSRPVLPPRNPITGRFMRGGEGRQR